MGEGDTIPYSEGEQPRNPVIFMVGGEVKSTRKAEIISGQFIIISALQVHVLGLFHRAR